MVTSMTTTDFTESAEQRHGQLERSARIFSAALKNETLLVDHRIMRPLLPTEIDTLRRNSCFCSAWSRLRVLAPKDEDYSHFLASYVSKTTFDGTVVLGLDPLLPSSLSKSSSWSKLPLGIHSNVMVSNCILDPNCRVHKNTMLSDTHVGSDTVVVNCGHVHYDANSAGSDQLAIKVGPESGGQLLLHVTPETNMVQVCHELTQGTKAPTGIGPQHTMNIFSSHCLVRDTPTIENVVLAPNSSIQAATSVSHAILLPFSSIANSSVASHVFLQWKSSIQDNSNVSQALLMEEAHSGPHSLVASSVLGPDVHVSAGEVHASLIGPNTNAHHQSLVIGVLWPLGRGNVGYGANVGSNHTGRLPDQETTSGEGTFWGLSSVIKFPVDLTYSPYSIVSAGTNLGPQRIAMPFSLIVDAQIFPGWVLSASPYTLARSEDKFAKRRKAKRHDFYTGWRIVRPETVEMCRRARTALQADGPTQGIGITTLTDKNRKMGIQAYTHCIRRFALQGLLSWMLELIEMGGPLTEGRLKEGFGSADTPSTAVLCKIAQQDGDIFQRASWPIFPWNIDRSIEWAYQRFLLQEEFPLDEKRSITSWIAEQLRKLVVVEEEYARKVLRSKKRDDKRGAATIPGYAECHVAAENDPVIQSTRNMSDKTASGVLLVLEKLNADPTSKL